MSSRQAISFGFFVFLLLGLTNIYIFWKRDNFQYIPKATDQNLYVPASEISTNPLTIYADDELVWAKNKSKEFVKPNMSSSEKVKAISLFLLNQFHDQRGIPPPNLMHVSARATYDALNRSKKNQVWCGHFGHLMLLFTHVNGIKGRYIEVFNPGNHHVFNEFYIPEWGQWVMTDMYNDIVFAKNMEGTYLNAQTFRHAVNSPRGIAVLKFSQKNLVDTILDKLAEPIVSYHTKANPYYYYTTTNLDQVYTFTNKLKRHFGFSPWYYIYNDNPNSNAKHYMKIFLFISWLFLGIWLIIERFKTKA
ncbi:transglutaminase domain-containing protein [Paracnuella aquatica]|uniref:transglutaminase domain-containing protein n=1 Tax=Paracnuella aquatica TaxID=2268757 RepID=UPI000DEF82E8|nr:transglutaminase domain-containing protein [Paracnuella aquatica]RPD44745.1 transglutaminase domain-containing protein [Paracnuella aquatica]